MSEDSMVIAALSMEESNSLLPVAVDSNISNRRRYSFVHWLVAAILVVVLGTKARSIFRESSSIVASKDLRIISAAQSNAMDDDCAQPFKNCAKSKCCATKGFQCYTKIGNWATCRRECIPGPDPVDINSVPWECKELGQRTPGDEQTHFDVNPPSAAAWVQKNCSGPGMDCSKTRCCKDAGNACYHKGGDWSSCKAACIPGRDPADDNHDPWNCTQLGMRTPGISTRPAKAGDWVAKECSAAGENCNDSGCCRGAGLQCYAKNGKHAQCLRKCTKGMQLWDKDQDFWSCKLLGARTPGVMPHSEIKVADWVDEKCSVAPLKENNWTGGNCIHTQCCKTPGHQCYQHNDETAECFESCTKFKRDGVNTPLHDFSCKKLGPRMPRKHEYPALFCFMVFMHGPETDLVKNQLTKGIGIFKCDEYAVFSQDAKSILGDGPDGELESQHFQPAPVWRSKDGTAANTQLFMHVWEAVKFDGRWASTDWTIKADPDAVVIPDRMRTHLKNHMGHPVFILTCSKEGMPDGPMMFGALEAISKMAMQKYYDSGAQCNNLPWQSWGEDLWLGNCLKQLGVSAEPDPIVDDRLCLWSDCGKQSAAAFHPYKDVGSWLQCYWTAER